MAAHLPGGFADLNQELFYWINQTKGKLPAGLEAAVLFNGPGRRSAASASRRSAVSNRSNFSAYHHPFDGDGMISVVSFSGGRAHFQNRYVRTPQYLASLSQARARLAPLGLGVGRVASRANMGIVYHGGRLLALSDFGRPVAIDAHSLETLGEFSFGGLLPPSRAFSGAAKVEPTSGALFSIGLDFGPRTRLHLYRVEPHGVLSRQTVHPLSEATLIFDFALSQDYLVVFLAPLKQHNDWPGRRTLQASFRPLTTQRPAWPRSWLTAEEVGTTVLLFDIQTLGLVSTYVTGPFFVSWCGPAYSGDDAHGLTVHALCRPLPQSIAAATDPFGPGHWMTFSPHIPSNFISYAEADKRADHAPVGRPVWNTGWTKESVRYVYHRVVQPEGIGRTDLQTGQVTVYPCPPGSFAAMPAFVPSSPAANLAEDDGYVVFYQCWPKRGQTDVLVLSAAQIDAGPIWTGRLEHGVGAVLDARSINTVFI